MKFKLDVTLNDYELEVLFLALKLASTQALNDGAPASSSFLRSAHDKIQEAYLNSTPQR